MKPRTVTVTKTKTYDLVPNSRLKAKIVEKFWSQAAFAKSIGIDKGYISKVVNDWITISEKKKQEWAKALDCRVEDIF